MDILPPKRALNLLRWFCREDYLNEIEGDIIELFEKQYATNPNQARWRCYWNVIRSFRGRNLKFRREHFNHNLFTMISHYLKIAWRGIIGKHAYSKLNILGLAIGFACSMLIFLWVKDETNVDHQHPDSDRIYNIYSRNVFEGGLNARRNTPALLPAELLEIIPEIEFATGFAKSFRLSLQGVTEETFEVGDVILKMKGSRGSPDFFEVFGFELLEGSASNALKDAGNIAISKKMAELFFGSAARAIGQTLRYQDSRDLKVTAVFEDVDKRSSLQFDYLTNWDHWVRNDDFKQSWGHFGTQTYVRLAKDADPELVRGKIRDFLAKYMEFDEYFKIELDLQRFEDQYLNGNFENGKPVAGRQIYVNAFQGVAAFILVIAILNFINLVTAASTRRAKEIGVRKTVGAYGITLKAQFLAETLLKVFLAFALSVGMVMAALPIFRDLTQKRLFLPLDLTFWISILVLLLVISLLAGAYPSFVLSRANLISIRTGAASGMPKSTLVRKGLVTFQFLLSILLIIATVVVTRQTQYLRQVDAAFDRSNLIYLPLEGELIEKYDLFRAKASSMPGVVMVDRSSQVPHNMGFSGSFANWDGKDPADQTPITPSSVGFDFVDLMKLEVVEGRGFSRDIVSDANNFVINETALALMGPDAVGKRVGLFGKEGIVVGVVKDFHFNSLHTQIKPLFLDVKEDLNFATVLVRLQEGNLTEGLKNLKEVHDAINPGYAFSYTFADDVYNEMYSTESTTARLIQYFAGLAIIITCLGLFGLVAHTTEQRVKEIGIRKVLGASVLNIQNLVSKDFALLMIVAAVVAIPLSHRLLSDWLSDYAYRIDLSWGLFGLSCLGVVFVAYVIIWVRVFRSAIVNPVMSLRNE